MADILCYEFTVTICGSTYTTPAYQIPVKPFGDGLLIPAIYDEENECLSQINFPLIIRFIPNFEPAGEIDCWVMYDSDGNPLFYIESVDQNTIPTDPYSSWTELSTWDELPNLSFGLITDFSIEQVACPVVSCNCDIVVALQDDESPDFYTASIVGFINGRPIYKIDTLGGDYAIYWSSVENRWNFDFYGNLYANPEMNPLAFLEDDADCPSGLWEINLGVPVRNPIVYLASFTANCDGGGGGDYVYPPIEDYCCVYVSLLIDGELAQFTTTIEYIEWGEEGELPTYVLQPELAGGSIYIKYNPVTQSWELWSQSKVLAVISTTFPGQISDICPVSSANDWIQFPENELLLLGINPCPEDVYVPEIGNAGEEICEPYAPCRNKNLLSKSAVQLSKDIASISKREVFGFNCEDAWNNIFMRSLIIDALNCLPYGTYSQEVEQCLIGKLTDKCNC